MVESIFALMLLISFLLLIGLLVYMPIKGMIEAVIERDFVIFILCLIPWLATVEWIGLYLIAPIINGGI